MIGGAAGIKTYQDLLECGEDENRRIAFIQEAIADYKSGNIYRMAERAQKYYDGENPTIYEYEKIIFDMMGRPQKDMYSANHKISSSFFTRNVDQEVGYLLGNGISFQDSGTKDRLGTQRKPVDQQVSYVAEYALIGGVAYGLWDMDHIEVFHSMEFVPLEDEDSGALKAGIRFWQISPDRPLRATLYELDGITDYIRRNGEDMTVLKGKRAYRQIKVTSVVDGTEIYNGENYPTLPIVPLKNNDKCKSSLCGNQNTIDALDLCTSNMVNNVDEGNIIYWALINCGGMDYDDAGRFLETVRKTHVAFMDNPEQGAHAEPHSIESPYVGTQAAIEMLEDKLYHDFQMFNASAVSAGNQTATAIWATYEPLDLKVNKFERQVTKFLNGILALAGIQDKPSYTRDKIINKMEETQTILLGAEYVTPEYITQKLLTVWGDADMVEQILRERAAEELERFDGGGTATSARDRP